MHLAAPLETPRLALRCLTAADVTDRYVNWLRDPEVTRYLESRFGQHSHESVRVWIEQMNESLSVLFLGVFLQESGEHIGNIKLGPIDAHHGRADIGLLLGEKTQWGRGYAAEAIARLTEHAIRELGLRKVTAGCYANNLGSVRAFQKAGFTVEARLPQHWVADDGVQDGFLMGVTAEAFDTARREAPRL